MSTTIPFSPQSHVVAYLRDSGGDDQDLSIPEQEKSIRSWCEENNLILTQVYKDAARPGSSTVGRTEFLAMIDHFHDRTCNDSGVILWKYNRFSRDIDDSQHFRSDLRKHGATIFSMNDNIPDSNFGRVFEVMIDYKNAEYLADLSVDVKRGLQHLVTEYKAMPGTPPIGFMRQSIEIGKRRDGQVHTVSKWVPDPSRWEVCQRAWELRAAGYTVKYIHDQLHILSNRGSYSTFFRNRIYIGEMVFGGKIIPDFVPAMIDRITWDKVQILNRHASESYSSQQTHPRRQATNFFLSGKMYCARCGSLMNGWVVPREKGKKTGYYRCSSEHHNMSCDAKAIPQKTIEDLVAEKIQKFILDPRLIEARDQEILNNLANIHQELASEIKKSQEKLDRVHRQIANITEAIADGSSTPRALVERLNQAEHEEGILKLELEQLKISQNKQLEFSRTPAQIQALSEKLDEILHTGDLEEKRSVLRLLIKRIDVERQEKWIKGTIYFYNPENPVKKNPDDIMYAYGSPLPGGTDFPRSQKSRKIRSVKVLPLFQEKGFVYFNDQCQFIFNWRIQIKRRNLIDNEKVMKVLMLCTILSSSLQLNDKIV